MTTCPILRAAAAFVHGLFRSRLSLQVEILALRHRLAVYQRNCARPRLRPADRILWAWLSRAWSGWREALVFVKPETVIAWRRRSFRHSWARLSRPGRPGRPPIPREIRDLIRRMSLANPLWGAPRIVGELAKIGIDLPKSTVAKYMIRQRKPPSVTWRAFLKNHVKDIVGASFTSTSPPTRLRSGQPSRSSRHARGTTCPGSSGGIATPSTVTTSPIGWRAWASSKSSSPLGRRGRVHSSNG